MNYKMKKKQTIAIIHYNTPELTEACIMSLRKTGCQWPVVVFDNSDELPFKKRMAGVKRIDNTKGQLIDFDELLASFPAKCWDIAKLSNYGSLKHIASVQKLWELLPDGFILVESDILLRQDPSPLWQEEYASVGRIQWHQKGNQFDIPRMLPFLCYINVPLLTANGARYYDPKRCWAVAGASRNVKGNWYDTGAAMLEDIMRTKPQLVARNIIRLDDYYVHYKGGSWKKNDMKSQAEWLKQNEELWSK